MSLMLMLRMYTYPSAKPRQEPPVFAVPRLIEAGFALHASMVAHLFRFSYATRVLTVCERLPFDKTIIAPRSIT
jgi:hypothetical protein